MHPNPLQSAHYFPLSGTVVFPGGVLKFPVKAMPPERFREVFDPVVFVLRRDPETVFNVGTLAKLLHIAADGTAVFLGVSRVLVERFDDQAKVYFSVIEPSDEALTREQDERLRALAERWFLANEDTSHLLKVIFEKGTRAHLVDLVAMHGLETSVEKQVVLETFDLSTRYDLVFRRLQQRVSEFDGDGVNPVRRAWRWWTTVLRNPEFDGWVIVGVVIALTLLVLGWLHLR